MKRDKKKLRLALLDALAELVLSLIFFGFGLLILRVFGVKFDALNMDGDLIMLLGIVVFVVIVAVVYALVRWGKKRRKEKRK